METSADLINFSRSFVYVSLHSAGLIDSKRQFIVLFSSS